MASPGPGGPPGPELLVPQGMGVPASGVRARGRGAVIRRAGRGRPSPVLGLWGVRGVEVALRGRLFCSAFQLRVTFVVVLH